MNAPCTDQNAILKQLHAVLASEPFRRARRSSAMLRFIVNQTIEGNTDALTDYAIGASGLGRGPSFDPRSDPVVQAVAARLRRRLQRYYATSGRSDPVLIVVPKDSYVPHFVVRSPRIDSTPTGPVKSASHARSRLQRSKRVSLLGWACAGVAAVAAIAGWIRVGAVQPAQRLLAQFEVELKSDGDLAADTETPAVLSPDGTRIVYVSRNPAGRTQLNWRRLDSGEGVPLSGTDGARTPFVSPDGQWVGFWADNKLKKTLLQGGPTIELCNATELFGASWGEGNNIVAALGGTARLFRISPLGGVPEVAIDLTRESTAVRWPQLLPGGDNVLYTAVKDGNLETAVIEVQSINGRNRKILVRGGTFGRYLADGYLTYVRQGALYTVRFNLTTLTVESPPIQMLDDVSYSSSLGYAQLDLSRVGTLLYLRGGGTDRSVVDWIDRSGKHLPLVAQPGRYGWPRLSPDGERLAFTTTDDGDSSVAVYDVRTGEEARVSTRAAAYTGLTWLESRSLVVGGGSGLARIRSVLPAESAPLTEAGTPQIPWSIAPNGSRLAYHQQDPDTGFDLWTAPILDTASGIGLGLPQSLLRTGASEMYPAFSPDGGWIAYVSNASGALEVYVRRFPDDGTEVRVSTSGGVVPRWSPNGHELLYQTAAHRLMVVDYKAGGDSFIASPPRPWSEQPFTDTGILPDFDIAPDGERIVALTTPRAQSPNHVTFMLNFVDEVRRRVESK